MTKQVFSRDEVKALLREAISKSEEKKKKLKWEREQYNRGVEIANDKFREVKRQKLRNRDKGGFVKQ